MNHKTRICCGIAALMLCIGCLTGCGTQTQEQPETDSAVSASENAAQESGAAAQPSAEAADAKAVLTQFLEGCKNSDTDAILAVADYRGLQQALDGDAFDEAAFRENIRVKLCEGFESYEIGEITSTEQDLAEFNEKTEQYREALAEDPGDPEDEDTKRCMDYLRSLMVPADDRCAYSVTVRTDGTESTDELVLLRYGDKWQLDLVSQAALAILSKTEEQSETSE